MKPIAFVFPGQGSQAVGMLDAWGDHPAVLETLAEASDALGEDIGALIANGPKEDLALTTNTQPVMLVAGVACWRAWRAAPMWARLPPRAGARRWPGRATARPTSRCTRSSCAQTPATPLCRHA